MTTASRKIEIGAEEETTSVYAYLEKPSMVDFPRHFAAVFFISGCNFTCGFCHNARLMGRKQAGLSFRRLREACRRFRDDWVNGVVITGGEPTEADDLLDIIRFFKEEMGFPVKLDTNGSHPDRLEACLPLVDYVAMDIKAGLSLYPSFVGFSDVEAIQRSIALVRERARDYEFRTTVIETVHTDEQMDEITELIRGAKRYIMQAFIPRDDLPGKEFRTIPRTTAARLEQLRQRIMDCAEEVLVRGA